MTLRLTDEQTQALREYAERSGRSMQDVAREAINDYVSERTKKRDEILNRIVSEDSALLDLLSK